MDEIDKKYSAFFLDEAKIEKLNELSKANVNNELLQDYKINTIIIGGSSNPAEPEENDYA